ncbi:hypothetical protein [Comamonas odontotermitis]|uniref:hypothetical protein n=1 Tax=Comamonas odontotermitis TaxID=379895 RepID=UPI001CC650F1|nr:hypothetical protein [Comamonas odontotermitis]UBB19512.1 hypothetical protein LAD35_22165 [Comamonas odontotermitis]
MARIERIKQRLDNWALWKSRMLSGGSGWATRNVLDVDCGVFNRGSYNGAIIPAFDEDAQEIDAAIKAIETARPHLVQTLNHIYLHDLGVKMAAVHLGCAEATVHARLGQADAAIDMWLQDQAKAKAQRRAAAEAEQLQADMRRNANRTFTS